MKKIATFAVLALFAASANALTLTSPFFMQSKGKVLSDTGLIYVNERHGATAYDLNERVSYAIEDNIQVGADIGYNLFHAAGKNVKGFYNPTIFGYYRFVDQDFNLDAGAEVTLGLFDNDVETKDYVYDVVVRGEKNINEFSFGGRVNFAFNDPKEGDTTKDLGLYVYGLYNFNEKLAAGVDFDYVFIGLGEDNDEKIYSVSAIGGYEFSDNMGLFGRAGFLKSDADGAETSPIVGVNFKVLF
ncbi:MAG: hypothetical protein LBG16_02500 [Elusimicrobiota bacterium]|jgi:hypothetical protein|nr:hypothetical protein [Elusimicrobiota bacterium]